MYQKLNDFPGGSQCTKQPHMLPKYQQPAACKQERSCSVRNSTSVDSPGQISVQARVVYFGESRPQQTQSHCSARICVLPCAKITALTGLYLLPKPACYTALKIKGAAAWLHICLRTASAFGNPIQAISLIRDLM